METAQPSERPTGRQYVRFGLVLGLTLLCLTVLLLAAQGTSPASADDGMLYVDGATGQDDPACGTAGAPCQTIAHTLNNRASDGDTMRIAAGIYVENLSISGMSLTLRGGYTISGTTWIEESGETVLDGGQTARTLFIHGSNSVLESLSISGGAADPTQCWGDTVWVTNGDVTIRNSMLMDNNGACSGIEVNEDFGPAHLTLEFSTVTNMEGNGALHVWGEHASVAIEDVTFTGNGTGNVGGAIHVDYGSSATIVDSDISSNSADRMGGGLAVTDGSSATIENSSIEHNAAGQSGGGVGVIGGSSATISGTRLYYNSVGETGAGGAGGAAYVADGTLGLTDCSVFFNRAPTGQSGAIEVGSDSTVTVLDSILGQNEADLHGGLATVGDHATLVLTNALVAGNSTTSGNANVLAINGGQVTVMNGTLADNNSAGAQAILLWSGAFTMTNSIMWNNALSLQAGPPCPTCFSVTYSDIQGSWPGDGNIEADPEFVGGHNYHLRMHSPCIDAGTNIGAPDHAIFGFPRPLDGDGDGLATVDMGVHEFRLYRAYAPVVGVSAVPGPLSFPRP